MEFITKAKTGIEKWFKDNFTREVIIKLTALLLVALLSMTVLSKVTSNPEFYKDTIQSIDDKKATVMGITAATAAASTALAAIPGDASTPIAQQILELSSYLMIVVCVLVLEKSLITVMGYLSFMVFIPVGCALLGVNTFLKRPQLKTWAYKLFVFALIIVLIIPMSIKIGDMIYLVNQDTVEQVTANVEEISEETQTEEDQSWLESMLSGIKDGVSGAADKAQNILNRFIDAIAILIITYCAIPVAVILIMMGVIKLLFGVAIPISNPVKGAKKLLDSKNKSNELMPAE